MLEFKNEEIRCDECLCKPVCKEIDNFKKYFNEIIELRKKSSLFDSTIKCPYFIAEEKLGKTYDCEWIGDTDARTVYEKVKEKSGTDPIIIGDKDFSNYLRERCNIKNDKNKIVEKTEDTKINVSEKSDCDTISKDYRRYMGEIIEDIERSLTKPYKKYEVNHIRDDENVRVRKLTDEELIKVVEKFLGL